MNFIEKAVEKWIKRHGLWVISIILGLSILFITAVLNSCPQIPFSDKNLCQYLSSVPLIYEQILLLIALVVLVILLLQIWEKWLKSIFRSAFLWLFCVNQEIDSIPPIHNWIYQGSLKVTDSLEITSSDSGALIKNRKFKDFKMTFKARILNDSHVGIVFRAQDLENYLMLQISKHREGDECSFAVNPHIKFLGVFEVFNKPHYLTRLKCNEDWFKVYLEVKKRDVFIKLTSTNDQSSDEYRWILPTHVDAYIIQKQNQNKIESSQPSDQFNNTRPSSNYELWFANNFGMVGFRASGKEKFLIKDLKVEKL